MFTYHICLVVNPWIGIIDCTNARIDNKVYKQTEPMKQPANYLLGFCKLS